MTTRAERARWRAVLAATPSDTAMVPMRAGKLAALLDALDATEACLRDAEERAVTAEARAMAAEGERDELRREIGAAVALARADLSDVHHHDGVPCHERHAPESR